jgi:hypothetical protein
VYFIYGGDASPCLIRAADLFTKKIKTATDRIGEKPLLITHAKHVSVWNLMEYEHIVVDKAGIERLEEMYREQ